MFVLGCEGGRMRGNALSAEYYVPNDDSIVAYMSEYSDEIYY